MYFWEMLESGCGCGVVGQWRTRQGTVTLIPRDMESITSSACNNHWRVGHTVCFTANLAVVWILCSEGR